MVYSAPFIKTALFLGTANKIMTMKWTDLKYIKQRRQKFPWNFNDFIVSSFLFNTGNNEFIKIYQKYYLFFVWFFRFQEFDIRSLFFGSFTRDSMRPKWLKIALTDKGSWFVISNLGPYLCFYVFAASALPKLLMINPIRVLVMNIG